MGFATELINLWQRGTNAPWRHAPHMLPAYHIRKTA